MNVSSRKFTTIFNPSKKWTDFRLSKTLALNIRRLGISGQSGETVLLNMYNIISSDPELVRRMKEASYSNDH